MSGDPTLTCSSADTAGVEALAEEVVLHRLQQTEEEYVGYCALLCRTGRLHPGKLRAAIWRDVVVGRNKVTPVPLLGDGIIRQFQEETRSQASASAATHSRVNTNVGESFDSMTGRPTPRAAHESGDTDSAGGGDATNVETEPLDAHESEEAIEGALQPSSRSDGANSESGARLSHHSNGKGAGTSPAASPASHHHRHFRHLSLEPKRSSQAIPQDSTIEDDKQVLLKTYAAPRRRAVSQLPPRARSAMRRYSDLWRAGDPDDCISSSYDLSSSSMPRPMAWYHLPDNCQPRVVVADIKRSLWMLYTKSEERVERRRFLKNMILRVLLNNPDRFYYQGLHELMGFVMYILSPYLDTEEVVSVCEMLLNTRWRKFSARRLTNSEAMLYAFHAVVAQEDPPLAAALEWCGVGPESHYAVSWVITWYVHSVDNVAVLTRLFDYFIADPTGTAVIYFTAAFVISQRKTIFEWIHTAKDEIGVDTDAPQATENGIALMARVYAQLSRLPGGVLRSMDTAVLEELISEAEQLATLYCQVVNDEEENFLRGDVKKLGMLSNTNTRNAALRLLWHFLPREWRNPTKVERVRRFVFWTSVMAAATAVVVGTAAVDAKQGGWVRSLLR